MKLAIMQPYVFPYLGYFHLIKAVDKFIFYDDVNFIQQGWINRNNILVGGKQKLFTIPLENPSHKILISDITIKRELYPYWKKNFFKTIFHSYSRAPFFSETLEVVNRVFEQDPIFISDLSIKSVVEVFNYLDIKFDFLKSSISFPNKSSIGQRRILDICKDVGASHYINPIGGIGLYDKKFFKESNIKLSFISSQFNFYQQLKNPFVPSLSIIDVMMFNDKKRITEMFGQFDLI